MKCITTYRKYAFFETNKTSSKAYAIITAKKIHFKRHQPQACKFSKKLSAALVEKSFFVENVNLRNAWLDSIIQQFCNHKFDNVKCNITNARDLNREEQLRGIADILV